MRMWELRASRRAASVGGRVLSQRAAIGEIVLSFCDDRKRLWRCFAGGGEIRQSAIEVGLGFGVVGVAERLGGQGGAEGGDRLVEQARAVLALRAAPLL